MKEGAPQLAKCNHEFALEACEHSLWPLHCRPEEEVNGAQERLAQAVWIKHSFRGCCQSDMLRTVLLLMRLLLLLIMYLLLLLLMLMLLCVLYVSR